MPGKKIPGGQACSSQRNMSKQKQSPQDRTLGEKEAKTMPFKTGPTCLSESTFCKGLKQKLQGLCN